MSVPKPVFSLSYRLISDIQIKENVVTYRKDCILVQACGECC
jgi:hypothetical protein